MSVHHCGRCESCAEAPDDGLPPAWSIETVGDEVHRLCDRCTRDHARSIEAKLDEAWW